MSEESISPTSSRIVIETVKGSHKLTIQGYSLSKGIGIDKHFTSDIFTVAGHQWAIYFYPDGKNPEDDSDYVSVFIALASEGNNVRALFELTLVDQGDQGNHMVHSLFDRPLETGPYTIKDRGSMWGYTRFFKRNVLEQSTYLKDDCLKINCTVGVVVSYVDHPTFQPVRIPESEMEADFGSLLKNMEMEEGSDIVANVAGEKLHEHEQGLAAQSSVLRSEFIDTAHEKNEAIIVTDMEPIVSKEVDTTHEDVPAKDFAQGTKVVGQLADNKKCGLAKATPLKAHRKTPLEDEKKKASTLSKCTVEMIKKGSDLKEASRPSSKRKRVGEKTPKTNVYGWEVVGATITIWRPNYRSFHQGVINSFDAGTKKHTIMYYNGNTEKLDLKTENWHRVTVVGNQLTYKKQPTQAKATPLKMKGKGKSPAKKKGSNLSKSTAEMTIDGEEASRPSSEIKCLSEIGKTKTYGPKLVGAKVKVWWPDDGSYYEADVAEYDACTKKHRILYSDGDVEILNLKCEKWMLVSSSRESSAESSDY